MTRQPEYDALLTRVPSAEPVSLEQLLGRCAVQDQAAFAEYYQLTSTPLNALLARRGISAARAESALVSTYVAIWRQSADFADSGHRSAWGWTLGWLDQALTETADQSA